ncbi:hypothetical protein D3C75_766340 [compost metagenome]
MNNQLLQVDHMLQQIQGNLRKFLGVILFNKDHLHPGQDLQRNLPIHQILPEEVRPESLNGNSTGTAGRSGQIRNIIK